MSEAPAPSAPTSRPRKGLAVASLVLGLLSVPTFGLLLVGTILSLVLGTVALVKASRHPAEYGGQKLAIAGIAAGVASVLVMPVLAGVMVALQLPRLMKRNVAANERAAIANVRAVMAAEEAYRARNGGFYDTLTCLAAPDECIESYQGPGFLAPELAALEPRHGYRYLFTPYLELRVMARRGADAAPAKRVPITAFAYAAVPLAPGRTGVRAFCGDASGRICYTVNGVMPDAERGTCPVQGCVPLE
jgi:hypothetical protein